ncbi:hypothetical protein [Natronincola ferrireducens]|uniref:YtxH-like protein n=1 Tax=Natronincola ferrireducens TaxID=393762 RepID=A0A1G9CQ94_9FIRM|nr:hypothetical protein [Natronincola ferrireducens]SDK53635.1 hypothetical protein SAMN05660472_01524 [Natronincola ferrireducens]
MKRDTMMGLITGGVIGATVGMYAFSNMSTREQKRMMKRGRKIASTAVNLMSGMNIF